MLKISFCEIWSIWSFFFCAIWGFCYSNLAGITKFKCENDKDSVGRSSKMTPWRHQFTCQRFFVISAQDCSFLNIDWIVIEKEHDYSDFCEPIHLQLTKVSFPG